MCGYPFIGRLQFCYFTVAQKPEIYRWIERLWMNWCLYFLVWFREQFSFEKNMICTFLNLSCFKRVFYVWINPKFFSKRKGKLAKGVTFLTEWGEWEGSRQDRGWRQLWREDRILPTWNIFVVTEGFVNCRKNICIAQIWTVVLCLLHSFVKIAKVWLTGGIFYTFSWIKFIYILNWMVP